MSRWRGGDRPVAVSVDDEGRTVVHLAADVVTITPGTTGHITVHIETLEELLEQAGYTRIEEDSAP